MYKLTLLALGLATVEAADWDYRDNGASWSYVSDDCADSVSNQSPIDLASPKKVIETQAYPIISSEVDKILKDYNNVKNVEVNWNGHTSQINVDNQWENQMIPLRNRFQKQITDAQYQTASYYAGPTEFNALQFHFHHESEHTIDGFHYDLEMHTVHTAKEDPGPMDGIGFAALGIMFDVKFATAKLSWAEQKVIDNFFESLRWDDVTGTPTIDIVNYGVLMTMVDFNNRYTYRGSVTTPPCARFVHWNLLSTVYPIQEKHVNQFKEQLKRNTKQNPPLVDTGNWRKTMPINGHNVMYIMSEAPSQSAEHYAMDQSGELYLLEGANDYKWLEEQEAAKYQLEETKPGQYHYVAKDDGTNKGKTQAQILPLTLPTISLSATKLIGSFAAAAAIIANM